ncbi:MAG: fructosamine kinase family protein [Gammaproteobacteria bacterium]|nr:fructosamine kinase family protein [Gammaproteobacteria bacterium]MDH3506402.1 fructosamine kinase family protein [Gammaproteobacteria bacterium]
MGVKLLSEELRRRCGIRLLGGAEAVGGGSINRAFKVLSEQGPLFLKLNTPSALGMFEAEAAGLEILAQAEAVRVPAVVAVGAVADAAYLILEWIVFGPKSEAAERSLGADLASQHRVTRSEFGWDRDNTIGSTPQVNAPTGDWPTFFCEHRLRYQLALAVRNGLPAATAADVERLLDKVAVLFDAYEPDASLLHGDLWGGNWGVTTDGTPVIFDPAVYYGDRETDLAMTRLFGGFGSAFYDAYAEAWPLAPGWERRVELYNLYHLLNHFNLFGAGYLASVQGALEKLLRYLP